MKKPTEDGEGALYFVKPKKTMQEQIDEIDAELQLDLKRFDQLALGLTVFFGLVVAAPIVGLLIAAAYKWWTK